MVEFHRSPNRLFVCWIVVHTHKHRQHIKVNIHSPREREDVGRERIEYMCEMQRNTNRHIHRHIDRHIHNLTIRVYVRKIPVH
jgi:hypothetical protein